MQPLGADRRVTPISIPLGEWCLRSLAESDAHSTFELLTDPDVARVRPTPQPRDPAEALEWIRQTRASPAYLAWVIEHESSGRLAGSVILQDIDPALKTAEVGYLIAPWARRKGVATAALRAVTAWALQSGSLVEITLRHGLDNLPSCKVAVAAGYGPGRVVTAHDEAGVGYDYEMHSIRSQAPTRASDPSLAALQIIGDLALLFTDIEGSTALLQRVGHPRYVDLLERHHRIMRAAIAAHAGEEIATEGDSFAVLFATSSAAIQAAVDAQRNLRAADWPGGHSVAVRMGIHVGEVGVSGIGHHGLALHETARVAGVGHGGQIVVSKHAHDAFVRSSELDGVELLSLGEYTLKDIGTNIPLFQVTHAELRAEFPPLRASGSTQHNLPAQITTLIGRETEVAQLADQVGEHRLVTLLGAGGVGKTRLALRVAADSARRFTDGMWFVDLASLGPGASILDEIRRAMHLPDDGRGGIAIIEALGSAHVLLVLDNCEHIVDAVAQTVDDLLRHCAAVHVLATSREPLGADGEVHWRVPSLDGTESVALFLDRARLMVPSLSVDDDELAAIERICDRLDGIPLAIELAAARVGSIPIADLEVRLQDSFRVLRSNHRGQVARHQTLNATLAWSYQLLTDDERRLFRRLAALHGPTEVAAIEATCSGPPLAHSDVADLVDSLHAKSLVKLDTAVRPARVQISEVVRQFARSEAVAASDADDDELARRHAQYFHKLSHDAVTGTRGSDRHTWLRRIDADRENFLAAIDWLSHHSPDGAAEVVVNLKEWIVASTDTASFERLRTLSDRTDISLRATALTNGLRAQLAGSFGLESAAVANRTSLKAIGHLSAVTDPRERIRTLTHVALGHQESDRDVASELARRAVDEAIALDDGFETAAALNDLIFVNHEHHPETTRLRSMLLDLAAGLGSEWQYVQALVDEALARHQLGQHDQALAQLSRAEEILGRAPRQRFGIPEDAQVWTVWSVLIRAEIGDTAGALLLADEALASLATSDSIMARSLSATSGQALLLDGDLGEARRRFGFALEQRDHWRYLTSALATVGIGEISLLEGSAREAYEAVAAIASGNRRTWVRARAHNLMARASLHMNDRRTALAHALDADRLMTDNGFVVPPSLERLWTPVRSLLISDRPDLRG